MAQTQLTISIENLAPVNGTLLTPFWFGFHNGNFDTHDPGRPASLGLERIAEDGIISAIDREFTQGGFGTVQGTVAGAQGALAPGETAQFTLALDGSAPNNRYFNYAAMLLPSNDFFVANNDEQEHLVFDRNGDFLGADFIVLGTEVFDAGTEVSNEVPANTCVG